MTQTEAYHELCAYTLTLHDAAFIHQHVVDSFAAQTADEQTKPIKLVFALLGLYLHFEKGLTGKQVQEAHQYLGHRKPPWPIIRLPRERGSITSLDVLAKPPGRARDEAIHAWCASVWHAFGGSAAAIAAVWSTCAENLMAPPARPNGPTKRTVSRS